MFRSYTSVFTNIFLFAFAIDHGDFLSTKSMVCGNSYYFIGIEHMLIIVVVLITVIVPDRPQWVRTFMKRVEERFKRETVVKNAALKFKTAKEKVKGLAAFKR